jgi:hypothetical protein
MRFMVRTFTSEPNSSLSRQANPRNCREQRLLKVHLQQTHFRMSIVQTEVRNNQTQTRTTVPSTSKIAQPLHVLLDIPCFVLNKIQKSCCKELGEKVRFYAI